jgi:carbamoyltransferase
MRVLGVSALSHDAAVAVVEDDQILFAAHAERYSRVKNDPYLNEQILAEALAFGEPDIVAWYERPVVKKLRHVAAGQFSDAASIRDLPARYLRGLGLRPGRIRYVSHHQSHAAAGALTSGFPGATVLVADAIGEFDTFSVHRYCDGKLRRARSISYPHSLGLLYSAFTRRCGLRPNEEEYILMGMAGFGRPRWIKEILRDLVTPLEFGFRLKVNVHRGIDGWLPHAAPEDLAASIQQLTEEIMLSSAAWARKHLESPALILGGGVALNCVANTRIAECGIFDRIWIMPNPGDAGSSLGAALAVAGRPAHWPGPYLGTDIPGEWPIREMANALVAGRVIGVARGRAEFGPRALGNRSLLADPRGGHVKDKVNQIKGREPFRPFAPVVLAEMADRHFALPFAATPYMQFVPRARHPDDCPATVHVDGTSRVQTVTAQQHPMLHRLLVEFHRQTGCPMLLNTSLNLKGEPLVNTAADAQRFATATGVTVF